MKEVCFMIVLRSLEGAPRFLSILHACPDTLSYFVTVTPRFQFDISYFLIIPSLTIKGLQGEPPFAPARAGAEAGAGAIAALPCAGATRPSTTGDQDLGQPSLEGMEKLCGTLSRAYCKAHFQSYRMTHEGEKAGAIRIGTISLTRDYSLSHLSSYARC